MIGFCVAFFLCSFFPVTPLQMFCCSGLFWLMPVVYRFLPESLKLLIPKSLPVLWLVTQLSGLGLGMLVVLAWSQWQLAYRLPLSQSPVDVIVRGTISGLPDQSEARVIFEFIPDHIRVASAAAGQDFQPAAKISRLRKLRLSWYQNAPELKPGQRWQLSVRLKTPRSLVNPAGFDYAAWHLTRGIDARGYVRESISAENTRLVRQHESVLSAGMFDRLRFALSDWLWKLPLAGEQRATLQALLVGDKRYLSAGQWQQLRDTGTVHLIIISGLHIGIACMAGYWLARLLQWPLVRYRLLRNDLRHGRIVIALGFAAVYAMLAGFSIPTQRALLMAAAVMLPPLFNITLSVWQRWWLAMCLVLAVQPLSPLQPGFWLSFFAVAVLITAAGRYQRCSGISARLAVLLYSQLVIFVGLMPLLLVFNGGFSWLSPVANLLAIPLVTLFLCLLLLLLPLYAMGFTGVIYVADLFLQLLWRWLQWLPEIAGDSLTLFTLSYPGGLAVGLSLSGIFLLLLPRVFFWRRLGWLFCLPLIFSRPVLPDDNAFRAWIFDVGQGLSVLIQTRQQSLLFDTGIDFQRGSVAESFIIPSMRRLGLMSLDKLIISHGDRDHAGGFLPVMQAFSATQVYTGSLPWRSAQTRYTEQLEDCRNQHWHADGVDFRFIQPEANVHTSENNRSCVLLVESAKCRLLLPGDAEAKAEQQLTEFQLKPDLHTWLVAGHHGSNTSTHNALLDWLQPDKVFFSSGYKNPYGHPAWQVRQRLEEREIGWLSTAENGALLLEATRDGCRVTGLRQSRYRYWYSTADSG